MKTEISQGDTASNTQNEKTERLLWLIIVSALGGGALVAAILAVLKAHAHFAAFVDIWWIVAFMGLSYLPRRFYTLTFVFMVGLVIFEAWGTALDVDSFRNFAAKHLLQFTCLAISAVFTVLFWLPPKRP